MLNVLIGANTTSGMERRAQGKSRWAATVKPGLAAAPGS